LYTNPLKKRASVHTPRQAVHKETVTPVPTTLGSFHDSAGWFCFGQQCKEEDATATLNEGRILGPQHIAPTVSAKRPEKTVGVSNRY